MEYPKFFNNIETIKLKDPLSNHLGTFLDGFVEFSYLEIVKASGHSCPTVAGAYLMALEGLKALYKDEVPQRGNIFVSFKNSIEEGNMGVIANVLTHITGATKRFGFTGIKGNFSRRNLMEFKEDIFGDIQLKRLDNNKTVDISYDHSVIEGKPELMKKMQKILKGEASEEEKKAFGIMWQERVEEIFSNIDKVITIK